jgi:microcompartment protein CcmL/EutN
MVRGDHTLITVVAGEVAFTAVAGEVASVEATMRAGMRIIDLGLHVGQKVATAVIKRDLQELIQFHQEVMHKAQTLLGAHQEQKTTTLLTVHLLQDQVEALLKGQDLHKLSLADLQEVSLIPLPPHKIIVLHQLDPIVLLHQIIVGEAEVAVAEIVEVVVDHQEVVVEASRSETYKKHTNEKNYIITCGSYSSYHKL